MLRFQIVGVPLADLYKQYVLLQFDSDFYTPRHEIPLIEHPPLQYLLSPPGCRGFGRIFEMLLVLMTDSHK